MKMNDLDEVESKLTFIMLVVTRAVSSRNDVDRITSHPHGDKKPNPGIHDQYLLHRNIIIP